MATAEGGELMLDPQGKPRGLRLQDHLGSVRQELLLQVISGDITEGVSLVNARTGAAEKLSNIFFAKGKTLTKAAKICCGDLGVATKLGSVKTGDTLGLARKVTALQGMTYDEPCYTHGHLRQGQGAGGQDRLRPQQAQ